MNAPSADDVPPPTPPTPPEPPDMTGLPTPPGAAGLPAPADPAAHPPAPAGGYRLPLAFTGSGSEYFRIWIVNLLLTLVTLGLYYPWAKLRKLRYFYGNTVAGEYGFAFHGEAKRMLRGYLLVGVLLLVYSYAQRESPYTALAALVAVGAVWPALLRGAQQFRLGNTSWRGIRFRFTGDLQGAYAAMLPLYVPAALMLAGPVLIRGEAGEALAGLGLLAAFGLAPWCFWRLKAYQHGHYAYGNARTRLAAGVGSFYVLFLKALALLLVLSLFGGMLVGAITLAGGSIGGQGGRGMGAAAVLLIVFGMLVVYGVMVGVIGPYVTARLQNLVWSQTRSALLRFESRLSARRLILLNLKNWLLMLLTLGLYWPFAAVAVARMRVEAVTVYTRESPDSFVAQARQRADDASGEAAGDLLGIDIGW